MECDEDGYHDEPPEVVHGRSVAATAVRRVGRQPNLLDTDAEPRLYLLRA